jgi:uncharacterized membrane protein YqjE
MKYLVFLIALSIAITIAFKYSIVVGLISLIILFIYAIDDTYS